MTEPDVCLFPQLSGIFFWKVLITFRLFKMVSLERIFAGSGLSELGFSEIASEFKMKAYFSRIYLYFSYNFGIHR